ncbi:MAG TPA: hypothetical protein ENK43_15490 [Planctomycetes bacterium]|nr:hypothetical protein [Planctomycetota bacterium]
MMKILILMAALLAATSCSGVLMTRQPEASNARVAAADLEAAIKLRWHDARLRDWERLDVRMDGATAVVTAPPAHGDLLPDAGRLASEVPGVETVRTGIAWNH